MPTIFGIRRILAASSLLLTIASTAHADAVSELASFSAFPRADLTQLSKAAAKPVRNQASGSARHIGVQTAYVVPGAPAEVASKMRGWNPARYPELKVYLYSSSASDFSRLASAPDNPAVRYLATASAQRSSDLQLTAGEISQLPAAGAESGLSGAIASAWAKILAGRAAAFASGGSASQPPYENSTPAVRPSEELSALLRGQEKIRQQFSDLLSATGIGRGAGSIKPDMYWELVDADGKGVLALGAHYSRPGANGAVQTASANYYASGGYYARITLHQLWPVEVEGRPSTLVWRGDMVSSAAVAGARGIERMGAESIMIKDVGRAVSLFRRDVGGGR
jgi:hypothetical protein